MNAQQLYREAGVLGANPVELIVRLYEKMVDDLRLVSDAIENKNVPLRANRIKHAILIVGHLESSLDFDKGAKVARDLEVFYKSLRCRLLHVQFHPSRSEVSQLITDLMSLREAWVQVERAENPAAATPAQEGATPGVSPYGAPNSEREHPRMDWQG